MTAYCFFDVRKITDPDKVAAYRRQVFATVEHHGGRYLVLGGDFDVVEGDWRPGIPVIISFPSLAQAHRWYDSVEYKPLKSLRLDATDSCAVFMQGYQAAEKSGVA